MDYERNNMSQEDICADGNLGIIEGSSKDKVVIQEYKQFGGYGADVVYVFTKLFTLHNGGFFCDIGANIGLVSIPIFQIENVYGLTFEPDPTNYAYLLKNLSRHKVETKNYNIALGSHQGKTTLTLNEENPGDHRISVENDNNKIEIRIDKLNNFLYLVNKAPLAAKIDTQGSEIEIIKGGGKFISKCTLITMEFWPFGLKRMNSDLDIMLNFLSNNFNYARHTMEFWHQQPLVEIEIVLKKMEEIYHKNNSEFYDFIFSKNKDCSPVFSTKLQYFS